MAFMGNRIAPVKDGEELDVKIEAVGEKGDGIARKNGFVLFVPGTRAGDEVRIRVTKVLRKAGFAEVIGKTAGPVASADKETEEPEVDLDDSKDSEDFGDEDSDEVSDDLDTDDDSDMDSDEDKK